MKTFQDERDIFFQRRLGMFVHWGLYAIPAWHEQILWRKGLKRKDYEQLIHQFNPTRFDPDAWIELAQAAGMQYLCFTAKHHDGFCMWNTRQTDYNVMNTPYGKDVLKQLAEACRRRGFPLSLYYSCPDWHHPRYPNQGRHHELFGPRPGDKPDIRQYYEYVKAQVRELCSEYGPIYQFFWDVNVAEYEEPEIHDMIRSLQPGILINDRGPGPGDYSTPERHVPEGGAFARPTEACQSLGRESWGYKEDEDYYSDKFLMQSIDKILAMGGNYLLNAGPKADGSIDGHNVQALQRLGRWYSQAREAFEGAEPASYMIRNEDSGADGTPVGAQRDKVLLTRKGNTLYVHLCHDLQTSSVLLRPLDIQPVRATLLHTGEPLEAKVELVPTYWREKPYLRIRNIPVNEHQGQVLILKLEFDDSLCE